MDVSSHKTFGSIIKQSRKADKLTREQLAERVDISVRYLTAIENDERIPRFEIQYKLIRCLGISADQIFYPEQQTNGSETQRLIRLIQQCDSKERKLVYALVNQILNNHNTTF